MYLRWMLEEGVTRWWIVELSLFWWQWNSGVCEEGMDFGEHRLSS